MFHCLYSQAKRFKKVPFALGGIAVGISTGTALLSSTAAWITNLIAVGSVGLYSFIKNMETGNIINIRQREIKQMATRLSLQQYAGAQLLIQPYLREIFDAIVSRHAKDRSHDVDRMMEEIRRINTEANHSLRHRISNPTAQDYTNVNTILQTLFGITSAIINIIANLENSKEIKSDPQSARDLSYLNLVVAIVCISLQYLIHMYTAKKLRPMATHTQNGESILSNAQESLFFRAVEITAGGCNERISTIIKEQERIKEKVTRLEKRAEEKAFLRSEEDEDPSTQISEKIVQLKESLANQEALLLSYQQQFKNLPERIQQSKNQLVRGFFEPRDIEEETEEDEETTVCRSFKLSRQMKEET